LTEVQISRILLARGTARKSTGDAIIPEWCAGSEIACVAGGIVRARKGLAW